ncbi:MAG: sulfatase [Bryobacteraceae bacterium]
MIPLFLFAIALPVGAASPKPPRPPNVLFITVDTLRADHLSCYGYYRKTSPYIDGLAAEGTRFARDYTVIPLTGPSHFALLTGRYPQEIGVRRNGVAPPSDMKLVSLPQVLRRHGYRRGAFVSAWPLVSHLTHMDRWFDHFDEDMPRRYQLFNSSRWAEDVTPKALKWLQRHGKGKKPFFLWVHYFDPHSPYEFRDAFQPQPVAGIEPPPMPWKDDGMPNRIRSYDSEIYYADHYIGKLLNALDKLGVRDSTLVVLTADHGESLGEHGYVGHGRHLYENIVHVPLIFRLPGKVAAGKVVDTPVSSIDVAPTILDVALGDWTKGHASTPFFTGKSLAASVTGASEPDDRRAYYVTFAGKKGYMPAWFSWLWVADEDLPLSFGHADGEHKVVWRPDDKLLRIEDLAKDPLERGPWIVKPGSSQYEVATAAMKRWFSVTESRTSPEKLSAHDREVLKSLGYTQ